MSTQDYGRGRGRKNRIAKANRAAEWRRAVEEGRVVRSQGGLSFAAFPTRHEALAAVARIQLAGMEADIAVPAEEAK